MELWLRASATGLCLPGTVILRDFGELVALAFGAGIRLACEGVDDGLVIRLNDE